MSQHFTHLHVHTDYSLLDGAISLDALVDFGKKNGLKALAMSDHGNIFGAVKFFEKCQKAGIKPVLGIEAYLTEDIAVKDNSNRYYHLIMLVQNEQGYRNLCKLIAIAYQEGFYFKPRIDYAALEKYSEGLIVTSGCLGGHIPQLLKEGNDAAARERIAWYLRVFGPDRFYLEVQPEEQEEQRVRNAQLFSLSKELGVQCVATCDSHYPSMADHEAHEIMLAIQTHSKMSDPKRMTFGEARVPLRTTEEMLEIFKDHPEAVWNTGDIADRCNFTFPKGKLFFPKFDIPQDHTPDSFFRFLCLRGLQELVDAGLIPLEQRQQYDERLELEMDLIIKMGFVGYFLVVSDFIQWAHRNGIPVGPGRGSAAGSLVAWALHITNVDPLKYNLLFERFLNPERVSMPDIDIDFCIEGRERVINYVRDRYGHEKVCQIITFGTMLAKAVIKDVARALGFPFEDSNALTSLIPEQLKITLHEAIEQEPRLKEMIEGNPQVKHLFDIAFRLEGLTRHASKHAAGIVISPEPIDEVLPVYVPPKTTDLVTQYAMTELETLGFLKIDFLGLKNLTLIDRVLKMIAANHGVSIDINKLPLDDAKAFALICQGKTSGVFQLESDGLKEVLRKLQPDKFEDIIAVNALYRPGPLGSGMVDDYIERRHGRQKIVYLFEELAPILSETYGVIVYQEQVMKIASTIGGYSLGEADILRRAMGKKKADVMAEQRELFVKRAVERSFNEHKAGQLFDLMAYFAGYGFNKSHSAAYAFIAYQTAYLKANYPAEFMACLISLEATHPEKMSFYLQEAAQMNIPIAPPNINQSEAEFTVVEGAILFGLNGIKNVGGAALESILEVRTKGTFKDLFDLCKRVDLRTVNKRILESLVYAGACDTLPGNRAQKLAELGTIMEQATAKKRAEETGQMGLFGDLLGGGTNGSAGEALYGYQPLPEFTAKEKLEKEKEVIGFYLSSHPLDTYKIYLVGAQLPLFEETVEKFRNYRGAQEPVVSGFGLLKSSKSILTKKGDRMAFAQLEDYKSSCEVIIFPRLFKRVEAWLDDYQVFMVRGALDLASPDKCKIKADSLVPLELLFQECDIRRVCVTLPTTFNATDLVSLQEALPAGKAPLTVMFHEHGKKFELATRKKVTLDSAVLQNLAQLGIQVRFEV